MNYKFSLTTNAIHEANGNEQSGVICLDEKVPG